MFHRYTANMDLFSIFKLFISSTLPRKLLQYRRVESGLLQCNLPTLVNAMNKALLAKKCQVAAWNQVGLLQWPLAAAARNSTRQHPLSSGLQ